MEGGAGGGKDKGRRSRLNSERNDQKDEGRLRTSRSGCKELENDDHQHEKGGGIRKRKQK